MTTTSPRRQVERFYHDVWNHADAAAARDVDAIKKQPGVATATPFTG